MKSSISIYLFLLICISGYSQSFSSLSTLSPVTIHLKDANAQAGRLAFSHFEVIDERPDTNRIGVHTVVPTFGNIHARQLVLHRSAAIEIADYLNSNYAKPGAPYTALVVLRNLWLSDANYLREDMIKDPDRLHERTHIRLKAEIYARIDTLFLPILRFDTLHSYKHDNPYTGMSYYSAWDRDLAGILDDMADSASRLTISSNGDRRLVSRQDIREYNRSRFSAPIGISAKLTPGVYTSFYEFRNNAPSIRDFEIKLEKKKRVLYIKEQGRSYYSHNVWGYCDGRNIFVMRDGVLCHAWREGKAFYFLGGANKEVTVPPAVAGIGKPGTPDPIFTIDMDSGKEY